MPNLHHLVNFYWVYPIYAYIDIGTTLV